MEDRIDLKSARSHLTPEEEMDVRYLGIKTIRGNVLFVEYPLKSKEDQIFDFVKSALGGCSDTEVQQAYASLNQLPVEDSKFIYIMPDSDIGRLVGEEIPPLELTNEKKILELVNDNNLLMHQGGNVRLLALPIKKEGLEEVFKPNCPIEIYLKDPTKKSINISALDRDTTKKINNRLGYHAPQSIDRATGGDPIMEHLKD